MAQANATDKADTIQTTRVQLAPALPRVDFNRKNGLGAWSDNSKGVIVIRTGFDPAERQTTHPNSGLRLSENSVRLLQESVRILRMGGLLLVYGPPQQLAHWGGLLFRTRDPIHQMIFKYWIALDLDHMPRGDFLKPSHLGLLLFVKAGANGKTPVPFRPETDAVRVPHANCAACGLNLKDWGGKKHLMNPLGAAPSDVWRDLARRRILDNVIPDDVLKRVGTMTRADGENSLHVVQHGRSVETIPCRTNLRLLAEGPESSLKTCKLARLTSDRVYLADCVSFLNRVKALHPDGAFDLAFADPPYNLEKGYGKWNDALADQRYLEWCDAWLEGMADTLKPGGSLFVLNLPKWAIHHSMFLNQRLEFRHWIVWDALSDPRGKLMPAHYSLLWYTKPGASAVCNYSGPGTKETEGSVGSPDAPKYCLRAACIKRRKADGNDEKVELTDVWFDIHRIKHKRDRDAHPCQLPEKLMERIIKLATRPGDLVFDPFCGAGTTAIAAAKLGRKFVVTEIDPEYARITEEKLRAMRNHAEQSGKLTVPRWSVVRPRRAGSKRDIETYLQTFARRLGRVPTEADVQSDNADILRLIDATYTSRSAAFKRAKVALAAAT